MAKYSTVEPKSTSGTYERLFGHPLAGIFTKANSTVIKAGSDMEKMIRHRCKPLIADGNDMFGNIDNHGIFVITPEAFRKATGHSLPTKGLPDMLAFENRDGRHRVYIIEIKLGEFFDTKKAEGERESVEAYSKELSSLIPFETQIFFVSFFATSKDDIFEGWKQKIPMANIMTGEELCEVLDISFFDIYRQFTDDMVANADAVAEDIASDDALVDKIIAARDRRRNATPFPRLAAQTDMGGLE